MRNFLIAMAIFPAKSNSNVPFGWSVSLHTHSFGESERERKEFISILVYFQAMKKKVEVAGKQVVRLKFLYTFESQVVKYDTRKNGNGNTYFVITSWRLLLPPEFKAQAQSFRIKSGWCMQYGQHDEWFTQFRWYLKRLWLQSYKFTVHLRKLVIKKTCDSVYHSIMVHSSLDEKPNRCACGVWIIYK